MIDVSIIIVSYNAKEYLRKCLESIEGSVSKKITYEVIVIDNASPDNSSQLVEKEYPHITLIKNADNQGFAKANNKGVKIAKGRYILFLNPDTLMKEGVVEGMVLFMDANVSVGASTCKLIMSNGKIDYAIHRGFPTPWNSFCYFSGLGRIFKRSRVFSGYTLGWLDLDTVHEVDAIAGAFMLVRRAAGEAVAWWDEDYFFNGEDIDFCYRLKKHGWKIFYVPLYTIVHYSGVSGGTKKHSQQITTATRESKKVITKYRFDAMRMFYMKHYKNQYPSFVNWFVMRGIDVKLFFALRK